MFTLIRNSDTILLCAHVCTNLVCEVYFMSCNFLAGYSSFKKRSIATSLLAVFGAGAFSSYAGATNLDQGYMHVLGKNKGLADDISRFLDNIISTNDMYSKAEKVSDGFGLEKQGKMKRKIIGFVVDLLVVSAIIVLYILVQHPMSSNDQNKDQKNLPITDPVLFLPYHQDVDRSLSSLEASRESASLPRDKVLATASTAVAGTAALGIAVKAAVSNKAAPVDVGKPEKVVSGKSGNTDKEKKDKLVYLR